MRGKEKIAAHGPIATSAKGQAICESRPIQRLLMASDTPKPLNSRSIHHNSLSQSKNAQSSIAQYSTVTPVTQKLDKSWKPQTTEFSNLPTPPVQSLCRMGNK